MKIGELGDGGGASRRPGDSGIPTLPFMSHSFLGPTVVPSSLPQYKRMVELDTGSASTCLPSLLLLSSPHSHNPLHSLSTLSPHTLSMDAFTKFFLSARPAEDTTEETVNESGGYCVIA